MNESQLREIDLRIHREVMGRDYVMKFERGGSNTAHPWEIRRPRDTETDTLIPCYTEHLPDSWAVVRKMHENDWWLYLSTDAYGTNAGFVRRAMQPDWKWTVLGETTALAICLAALEAISQPALI